MHPPRARARGGQVVAFSQSVCAQSPCGTQVSFGWQFGHFTRLHSHTCACQIKSGAVPTPVATAMASKNWEQQCQTTIMFPNCKHTLARAINAYVTQPVAAAYPHFSVSSLTPAHPSGATWPCPAMKDSRVRVGGSSTTAEPPTPPPEPVRACSSSSNASRAWGQRPAM